MGDQMATTWQLRENNVDSQMKTTWRMTTTNMNTQCLKTRHHTVTSTPSLPTPTTTISSVCRFTASMSSSMYTLFSARISSHSTSHSPSTLTPPRLLLPPLHRLLLRAYPLDRLAHFPDARRQRVHVLLAEKRPSRHLLVAGRLRPVLLVVEQRLHLRQQLPLELRLLVQLLLHPPKLPRQLPPLLLRRQLPLAYTLQLSADLPDVAPKRRLSPQQLRAISGVRRRFGRYACGV